jgi:PhoD-like phosphatase
MTPNDQPPRRTRLTLSPRTESALHVVAMSIAGVVLASSLLATRFNLLDERPGGTAFEISVKPLFTAMFALGAATAWRWKLVGGALAGFSAAGLSAFAIGQLEPASAILVLAGFAVPGFLWVLVDLADKRAPVAIAVMAVVGVAITTGTVVSADIYDDLYGPSHPTSSAPALGSSPLRWIWAGGVTSTSAVVVAGVGVDADAAQLLVARSADFDDATVQKGGATPDDHGVVRLQASGLEPATQYHYAVMLDGVVDRVRTGAFRTSPEGPSSFTVAIGACARVGSNGAVFDAIRSLQPDLFIIDGDWNYANLTEDDQGEFREIYDYTLTRPGQSALFRALPVAYIWDDHDYGGNNGDATSPTRDAALSVYREFVPHYPLRSPTSAIYQAFTIGRVRFLLTDTRSARSPGSLTDDADKTMLGDDQKAWLLGEMLAADRAGLLTVWVSPTPWIAPAAPGADTWAGYDTERREIANFISAHELDRIVMLSGDAHMIAIDDGTNTDYSTRGGGAAFPLLHAAALDRPGNVKGGPYSEGTVAAGGQFGLLEIDDVGGDMRVTLSGRDWRGRTLVSHQFVVHLA